MSLARFSNFQIEDGRLEFLWAREAADGPGSQSRVQIRLGAGVRPSGDQIAAAVGTIAWRDYDRVVIDLYVSEGVQKALADYTGAEIDCLGTVDRMLKQISDPAVGVNFSGGIDSLAATALCPDAKAISISWDGQRFARERQMFRRFNTHEISTNIRYIKKTGAYMAAAPILLRDHLGLGSFVQGTILETPANEKFVLGRSAKYQQPRFWEDIGIERHEILIGLTEIGTMRIANHYFHDEVGYSIASCADPGHEKRFRKEMLATIVGHQMGRTPAITRSGPPTRRHVWGDDFLTTFLAFWFVKHATREEADLYMAGMSRSAVEIAHDLSLEFYGKLNPNMISCIPVSAQGEMLVRMAAAGVGLYSDADWAEYEVVSQAVVEARSAFRAAQEKYSPRVESRV